MKTHYSVGFKIQKKCLLWWLVILFTILLVVAIGMFVFLSLNAKYNFACVLGCAPDSKATRAQTLENIPPSVVITVAGTQSRLRTSEHERKYSENPTQKQVTNTKKITKVIEIDRDTIISSRTPIIHSNTPPSVSTKSVVRNTNTEGGKSRSHSRSRTAANVTPQVSIYPTKKPLDIVNYINITGKISFKGKAPKRLSRPSRLIVKFEEGSLADATPVVLAKSVVDLSKYRQRKPLFYTIICKRPPFAASFYTISAVFNRGWKPRRKNKWIRKGDFLTDTNFRVHIKKSKTLYQRNIQLVKYK